jgi:putative molybdopterin biosynthesis protein
MNDDLANDVRIRRQRLGMTQAQLATHLGITRQALSLIEAGKTSPSTTVALRLAKTLGCQVEELFWLEPDETELTARLCLAQGLTTRQHRDERPRSVILGKVDDEWIAHEVPPMAGLFGLDEADGRVSESQWAGASSSRVRSHLPIQELERHLIIAGCAPSLGLLTHDRVLEREGRVRWISMSSGRALGALKAREVHIAGLHLPDSDGGGYNLEAIRRTFGPDEVRVITLAEWTMGIVTSSSNPLGVRTVEDLLRPDLRIVGRPEDSGAHQGLVGSLLASGLNPSRLTYQTVVASHAEVALAINSGLADAGPCIEPVARALGLDFIPIATERFDLVLRTEYAERPAVQALFGTLASLPFRRQLNQSFYCDVSRTAEEQRL